MDNTADSTMDFGSINEVQFCDYIEVSDSKDDIHIYNVIYSKGLGFGLKKENEPFILGLLINNSMLIASYPDGERRVVVDNIKEITLDDSRLKRRCFGVGIEGTLLRYSYDMAKKYSLSEAKSHDGITTKIKKRTIIES